MSPYPLHRQNMNRLPKWRGCGTIVYLLPNFSAFHASLSSTLCGKVHLFPLHRLPRSNSPRKKVRGIGRMDALGPPLATDLTRSRRLLDIVHSTSTLGSFECRFSWKHLCVIKSIRVGSSFKHLSQTRLAISHEQRGDLIAKYGKCYKFGNPPMNCYIMSVNVINYHTYKHQNISQYSMHVHFCQFY